MLDLFSHIDLNSEAGFPLKGQQVKDKERLLMLLTKSYITEGSEEEEQDSGHKETMNLVIDVVKKESNEKGIEAGEQGEESDKI